MATRKKAAAVAPVSEPTVTAPVSESPVVVMSTAHEQAVIAAALAIVEARLKAVTLVANSAEAAKTYLKLQLGALEREVFGVMFLNAQSRMIAFEILFQGTLTQSSVYPREVARRALMHNAAAVILAHNHPSGSIEPSRSDKQLTSAMKWSMSLIEVKVLDHIIVGGVDAFSFAEAGMMDDAPGAKAA